MQVVIFELGGEKYGLETSRVQGIDKMMDMTNVPCSPEKIRGLVNLRGNIITVVDPYTILGISDEEKKPENIIIIETGEEILGIMVDKVAEVVNIDSQMIKNVAVSKEDDREYIEGTVNLDDYIVTLINIDSLLAA